MLRLLVCLKIFFAGEGLSSSPPQTPPLYLYLFIISVFKKLVQMSCATVQVDTLFVPRLAKNYRVTEWAWYKILGMQ